MSVYHPGVAEDTASIVKVDVLATLLAQAQAAGRFLTAGQQALAVPMIEQSDNDDAEDLWDSEGGARARSRRSTRSVHLVKTVPAADGELDCRPRPPPIRFGSCKRSRSGISCSAIRRVSTCSTS